jgi:hypothetical protein
MKHGQHWLVTPQEKQSIAVEDAAFIAVDVKPTGDALAFRLNTDDLVIAGPDHPIRARAAIPTYRRSIWRAARNRGSDSTAAPMLQLVNWLGTT